MKTATGTRKRHVALLLAGPALAMGAFAGAAEAAPRTESPAADDRRSATAVAPTSCAIRRLPLPAGLSNVEVVGGDPTGRYLLGGVQGGDSAPAPTDIRAVIWRDGEVAHTLRHAVSLDLADVNTSGVAVGSTGGYPDRRPSVYRDGVPSTLPGEQRGRATAINDRGMIAGTAEVGADDRTTAVRWASTDASPVTLPVPDGHRLIHVKGIDEDGTVLGVLSDSADHQVAYVWGPDGSGYPLPRPPMAEGIVVDDYDGSDIRNGYVAVNGWVYTDGEKSRFWAYRYDLRTKRYEQSGQWVAHRWLEVTAVNNSGWMTGFAGVGPVPSVLVTDRGYVELPPLGDHADADTIAATLSDDGRTIGGTVSRGDFSEPVMWRCA